MAEKVVSPDFPKSGLTNVQLVRWADLDQDDSGKAFKMAKFADKTVQIFGVWGGASVSLYGSNDPKAQVDADNGTLFSAKTASWVVLTDAQGNAITKTTTNCIEVIEEDPLYYLPVVTGGDGTTDLTIIICGKRTP